ncbi:MAG: hypothetical protein ACP5F3_00125 [Candidatus Syntrophosphaera sp.]
MAKNKERLHFGRLNLIILIIAAVLLILGYIIMSFNEITISPLILVAVYVVLVPLALLYKGKSRE